MLLRVWMILLSLVMLCGFQKGSGRGEAAAERPVPVKVMRVISRDMTRALDYVGDIKAREEAFVYPKTSGKVAEKIKAEGASLRKGEPILYLDRDETGYTFEKAPVESPLSGVLGRLLVDAGSHVTPQTPVALVVDMEEVKVIVEIPEGQLSEVRLGQEARVTVDAYPGEEFGGAVTEISPVLDPASRTATAEIKLANKDYRLKSGMYARVMIVVARREKMPAVLKEALLGAGENRWVYAVEDGQAVRKAVVTDLTDEPYVGVKEGVDAGATVVVVGHQKLADGMKVAVEMMESP